MTDWACVVQNKTGEVIIIGRLADRIALVFYYFFLAPEIGCDRLIDDNGGGTPADDSGCGQERCVWLMSRDVSTARAQSTS